MVLNFFVIGQVLTFISYLVFWISRFFKIKKNMLLWDTISRLVAILAFFFLGTFDGVKNTVFVIIRNYVGKTIDNKNKKVKILAFLALLFTLTLLYCYNFNNLATIAIALCGIFNLYGTIMCDEQGIRLYGMIGSIFYMAFMVLTENYVGFVCEMICFLMIFLSYLKYKNKVY